MSRVAPPVRSRMVPDTEIAHLVKTLAAVTCYEAQLANAIEELADEASNTSYCITEAREALLAAEAKFAELEGCLKPLDYPFEDCSKQIREDLDVIRVKLRTRRDRIPVLTAFHNAFTKLAGNRRDAKRLHGAINAEIAMLRARVLGQRHG